VLFITLLFVCHFASVPSLRTNTLPNIPFTIPFIGLRSVLLSQTVSPEPVLHAEIFFPRVSARSAADEDCARYFPTIAAPAKNVTLPSILSMDALAQAITKLESSSEQVYRNSVSLVLGSIEGSDLTILISDMSILKKYVLINALKPSPIVTPITP